MNALTAVKPTPAPVAQQYPGFSFTPSAQSPRLLELTFSAETTTQFLQQVAQWPVQALEYKSFLRFQVGKILDDLCGNQLQPLLIKTLLDRAEGALLINGEGIDHVSQAEEMVKLATAVAHLIGRSNFDAMSGQYYARFVVKNVDNSDSYLRQPHRVMELHNDGTYVEEQTDYVLMMKIDEQNMQGGNSCCCISTTGSISTNSSATRSPAARCAGPRRRAKRQQGCFPPGVRRRFAGPPGNALYRPVRPAERFRRRHLAEPPLRRAGDQQKHPFHTGAGGQISAH